MDLKPKHWILAVLTGVLLGLLVMVLLYRAGLARSPGAAAPSPPADAAGPAPAETETPAPAEAAEPTPAASEPTPQSGQPPASSQAEPTPEPVRDPVPEVERALDAFSQTQTGGWGLCFQLLPTGERLDRSANSAPMVSASLIKLFIMSAVYEQIDQGLLTRDQVYSSLYAMITVSDNGSANELVRLLGAGDADAGMAAVNAWCEREGFAGTRMNRLMLVDNGLQNYTTAADCAALLGQIYRGACVSGEASREMLSLLLAQEVNDRLPVLLPPGTPVAHKTGDLIGLCWADVGIVFSPGGDYVLCVISDGQASEGAAKSAASELSLQIYRILNPEA